MRVSGEKAACDICCSPLNGKCLVCYATFVQYYHAHMPEFSRPTSKDKNNQLPCMHVVYAPPQISFARVLRVVCMGALHHRRPPHTTAPPHQTSRNRPSTARWPPSWPTRIPSARPLRCRWPWAFRSPWSEFLPSLWSRYEARSAFTFSSSGIFLSVCACMSCATSSLGVRVRRTVIFVVSWSVSFC